MVIRKEGGNIFISCAMDLSILFQHVCTFSLLLLACSRSWMEDGKTPSAGLQTLALFRCPGKCIATYGRSGAASPTLTPCFACPRHVALCLNGAHVIDKWTSLRLVHVQWMLHVSNKCSMKDGALSPHSPAMYVWHSSWNVCWGLLNSVVTYS